MIDTAGAGGAPVWNELTVSTLLGVPMLRTTARERLRWVLPVLLCLGLVGCLTNPNQAPVLLRGDALEFPPAARDAGLSGSVVVRYRVTAAGAVRDAEVVSAEPAGVFEAAALKAVRGWRFRPGRKKGVATDFVGLTSTIEFKFGETDDYPER